MPDPIVLPRLSRTRGSPTRSATWWGRAFVRSFEELTVDAGDLVAARTLSRSGRLGAIVVIEAMASAVVDPGDERAVMAQVKLTRLTHEDWSAFAAEAARESGYAAALEARQLPADLVEHADEAGVELLPGSPDIETACECEEWANPCLHALALLYQLARHIDDDPYVLALLRGRTREALLAEVGAAAAGPARPDDVEREDARVRAARVLALSEHAPDGHGLADAAVAEYDEQVSRLL